jgi:hypothetical protein
MFLAELAKYNPKYAVFCFRQNAKKEKRMFHTSKGKRYILLTILSLLSFSARAQYIGEAGFLGGVMSYNGDANTITPFGEVNPMAGAMLSLKMNSHFLFRVDVDLGKVSGNTNYDKDNYFPEDKRVSFERNLWNIGALFELNFFKFGYDSWDKEVMRHTPYVVAGPSVGIFNKWNGTKIAGGLAFGLGYKVKVTRRMNIGLEWDMHKLFCDDLDEGDMGNEALDDPYKMNSSSFKNNDWYSCAFAYITFDMFKHRGICRGGKY